MRTSLAALLLLCACSAPEPAPAASAPALPAQSPSWQDARAAGVDFRGIGQEPGWLLDIYTSDRIVLEWDYGEQRAAFALPEATSPVEGQTRHQTQSDDRTLTIVISRAPCQDVMSGEAFPATVEVAIDDRTLQGCGRSV
jgi:uncharacterized membrane protein